VIGVGYEKSIDENWIFQIDEASMKFGTQRYEVNQSGNNKCGADGEQQACPHEFDNSLSMIRIPLVNDFKFSNDGTQEH